MDFTSQLANLQRSANRASSSSSGGGGNRGGGRGRGRGGGGCGRWNDNSRGGRGGGGMRGRSNNYYSGHTHSQEDDGGYGGGRPPKRGRHRGGGGGRYHRDGDHHDTLASILERVPPYQPAAAAAATTTKDTTQNEETKTTNEETKTTKKENHLTLCFLTINDILHEHIWRNWLTTTTTSNMTVSIVCHAKYPQSVKSEWLKRRLLVDRPKRGRGNELAEPKYRTYRPDWGSVEITRAMIELMKEGLRIGEEIDYHGRNEEERWLDREEEEDDRFSKRRYIVRNADGVVANDGDDDEENDAKVVLPKGTMPFQSQRFLFVSETCIPITTLAQVEKALFGDGDETTQNSHPLNGMNKSWLKARSTPNNGYARQKQWDCVRAQDVPSKHIWKADQWIVLTREHAMAVCRTLPHFINDQRRGGRRPPQQQELWEYFRQMTASDEIYFPTALSILGILKRPAPDTEVEEDDQFFVGPEVVRRRVTYCDWSTCAKNPASFGKKDIGDVYVQGRKEGCLIARKFGGVIRKQQGQSSSGGEDDENGLLTVEEWRKVVVKE
uniref:Uncharacterized protein n=1 Tax=Ditylum brightwellii TaxID=49249 RepID=A0A7S4RE95_9STRA|mmetsp:Transcript_6527/g.8869  ORF Transcript_6527/g.8869 Transcript_6527/m.8869 type:complete len:553 (+) Transcript_6527:334-1992(+)